jgi:hypothetical protein
MDVFPTVAGLCGTSGSNPLDGVDIWPLLSGSRKSIERDALLMFEGLDLQCARYGEWKLHLARPNSQIYNPSPAGGRKNLPLPHPELYRVTSDVDESYDLAPEKPEVVEDITERIDRIIAGMPEPVRKARAQTLTIRPAQSWQGALPRPAAN